MPPLDLSTAQSLADALSDFSQWLAAQGAGERTIRDRLTVIRAFGQFRGFDPRLAEACDVMAYLARPDLAAWSRLTYWNHLQAWCRWMQTRGRTDSPLDGLRSPKTPAGMPRPLTRDQVEMLLAAADPRMRTWLLLGLHAGLRAFEIAKIRGADFDGVNLYVIGKAGKKELLPADSVLLEEAARYGHGFWFPSYGPSGHLRSETVSHTSSIFFSTLGIEGAIHRCRHTYGTELLRAGANIRVVQSLMRHSSLNTTARYTAVDETERHHAIGLLPMHGAA